jgi:hypothetical protein
MNSLKSRLIAALFASGLPVRSERDLRWITITSPSKLEDFYARSVTQESSEDTEMLNYLEALLNIYPRNILAGSPLSESLRSERNDNVLHPHQS